MIDAAASIALGNPDFTTSAATPSDADGWRAAVQRFYHRKTPRARTSWRYYYYRRIQKRVALLIEPDKSVLEIGCAEGDLLAALKPTRGLGIDIDGAILSEARQRHPNLEFRQMSGEQTHALGETFDYIVISQTLGEIYDLTALFDTLRAACHARTRLVVVHHSRVWQPFVRLMEALRLKSPSPAEHNWLPSDEVVHLLRLSDFEAVRRFGMTLLPLNIPLLSPLINRIAGNLPGLHNLGLSYVIVARPAAATFAEQAKPKSVTIAIPARNEAGHIKPLLARIPRLAPRQEIIFIEGNSTDDTWDVIQETVANYDGPFDVRCMQQDGKGKGDAVRKAFRSARGDALIILDADISVPPEELPRFVSALATGKGEFINGSRMVYTMDKKAMRFLNLLGNKTFGLIFTWLLSQRFRDTLCGTKVLLKRDYERIVENKDYFGDFDPFGDFELLFGASKLNLKIVDVPVHYKERVYGETNISRFRHGLMLLRMCGFAAAKLKFV